MQSAAALSDESPSQELHPYSDDTSPRAEPQPEPQHNVPVDREGEGNGQHPKPLEQDVPALTAQPDAMIKNDNLANSKRHFKCDTFGRYRQGRNLYDYVCDTRLFWPHKCAGGDRKRLYHCLGEKHGEKCSTVFKSPKTFNRHYSTVHISQAKVAKFECPSEGCPRVGDKGFTRKDNLLQHQRSVHGENIPKNLVRFNGCDSTGRPLIKGDDGDDMTD